MERRAGQWRAEETRGLAGPFHARTFDHLDGPTVWTHRVDAPALVLGSTTDEALVRAEEAERLGVEVCRRRSGGGLVLVEPECSCWIDLLVPREESLRSPAIPWDDDVNRSFGWIGGLWNAALAHLGQSGLEVWNGPLTNASEGAALCFAGLGPGEVVGSLADGRAAKVVGLSQRRTRWGARFQGLYVARWSPDLLAATVAVDRLPEGLRIDELQYGAEALSGRDRPPPSPDAVGRAVIELLDERF